MERNMEKKYRRQLSGRLWIASCFFVVFHEGVKVNKTNKNKKKTGVSAAILYLAVCGV